MNIHGMILVRNEASRRINGRFVFEEVLKSMYSLCTRIVILDDNSTDDTVEYLKEVFGNDETIEIVENEKQLWDVNELSVRQQLWNSTIEKAGHNDWIVCLDADELILPGFLPYIKYLFESLSNQIDVIGFRLHDMWDNERYRFDDYWIAHLQTWPFAMRYKKDKEYTWNNKKLHCGRLPNNLGERMLPTLIPVQHFGWADEKDRKAKYTRYMAIDPHGQEGVLEQYMSILDPHPNLVEFGRCCVDD